MNSDDEQNRENWVRITLRLPPDLHASLVESARLTSLNAEIIVRLEESFRARFFEANERLARLEESVRARSNEHLAILSELQAENEKLKDELIKTNMSVVAELEGFMRMNDARQAALEDIRLQVEELKKHKPGGTE